MPAGVYGELDGGLHVRHEKSDCRSGPRGFVHVSNCYEDQQNPHHQEAALTYIWKRFSRISFEL